VLMDGWITRHLDRTFDANGDWASGGSVIPALLELLLRDGYFGLAPPKSTGRERFNMAWLEAKLESHYPARDVQATLLELTARGIADALARYFSACEEAYLCGGGAHNRALVNRLRALLPRVVFDKTDALGIPAQQVEAAAFSWLARQCVERRPIDLRQVTGARHASILGAIYPA